MSTYPYGMKGSPMIGKGAPGLPNRNQYDKLRSSYIVVTSAQTVIPPAGAKLMRVAAVGKGADSSVGAYGGGGGGCAASKLVTANAVSVSFPSNNAVAEFPGYRMVGKAASGRTGGGAEGGDFNFTGGNGSNSTTWSGGGAAGPNGSGASAASPLVISNSGWGDCGGGGGPSAGVSSACAGGGPGLPGNQYSGGASTFAIATNMWGSCVVSGAVAGIANASAIGAGAGATSSAAYTGGAPGVLIEWFY